MELRMSSRKRRERDVEVTGVEAGPSESISFPICPAADSFFLCDLQFY